MSRTYLRVTGHAYRFAVVDGAYVVTCPCGWSITSAKKRGTRDAYKSHLAPLDGAGVTVAPAFIATPPALPSPPDVEHAVDTEGAESEGSAPDRERAVRQVVDGISSLPPEMLARFVRVHRIKPTQSYEAYARSLSDRELSTALEQLGYEEGAA